MIRLSCGGRVEDFGIMLFILSSYDVMQPLRNWLKNVLPIRMVSDGESSHLCAILRNYGVAGIAAQDGRSNEV